ncbi:MAG: hypothetical protein K2Z80_09000 [Xanthobacteraceae bacterium]|nr:hypothetical protein [Xanthobacteraceae bacterium]
MWFRSATKPLAAAVLGAMLAAMLGGCSDMYYDRRDTISLVSGEAMAANRVTHVIDPWPPYAANRNIAYNGEKAAVAVERYRTGRVIPPVNTTTSSAAYSQAAQQAQSAANGQASSAPAGSSNGQTK